MVLLLTVALARRLIWIPFCAAMGLHRKSGKQSPLTSPVMSLSLMVAVDTGPARRPSTTIPLFW